MKPYFLFLLFISLLTGCQKNADENTNDNQVRTWKPVMNTIEGSYEGSFPCQNCDAKNIRLKLDMDQSAIKTVSTVGEQGQATTQLGEWAIENDVVILSFNEGSQKEYYEPKPDQLIKMNNQTTPKKGKDAKKHLLEKVK